MMCWTLHRYEKHILAVIRCALSSSRETFVCIHTNATHNASTIEKKYPNNDHALENAKLDAFVRSIQQRNNKPLTERRNVRKTSVREAVAKHQGNTRSTVNSKLDSSVSRNVYYGKEIHPLAIQNLDSVERNSTDNDQKLVSSSVKCLNITNTCSRYGNDCVTVDTKGKIIANVGGTENIREPLVVDVPNQSSLKVAKSTVTSQFDMESVVISSETSASLQSRSLNKLTKEQQATLAQLLDDGKLLDAFASVESHDRNNFQIPFGLLCRLCGSACVLGQVDIILKIKKIAEKSHPHLYKKDNHLDTYLASALCYSGNYQGSLDKVTAIYKTSPKGIKRVRDTGKHIIFHIMNTKNKDNEEMVLNFVTQLAEEFNVLNPALSLWRFCFCSDIYQHHRIADNLLENHPALIELLSRKLDNVIKLAYSNGDLDLLHRIFKLLLFYKLSDYYTAATTALLKHQCEIGDVAGADETIKFATVLKVQLKPSDIQRFLAMLHQLNRPAPIAILEMKYRMPPKPSPVEPASFVYKF